ncbi:hypothetical protein Patl1_06661 [Pistacia atlantica]|uniref:Uncharacterized protein n=1 Tax=Pistacia atlantica TaxID=434234 RepID=A0ACC1BUJ3_9ROSI|nr:hypothetical protein Patl1_06661 [Pistacia atlantica]
MQKSHFTGLVGINTNISYRNVSSLAEGPEAVPVNIPELPNLKHFEITTGLADVDCLLPCAAFLKAYN